MNSCKKVITLIFCTLCFLFSSTTILSAPETTLKESKLQSGDPLSDMVLQTATVCHEIYQATEQGASFNVVLSEQTILEMVNAVADLGHAVIDQNGSLDMRNPNTMLEYGIALQTESSIDTQAMYFTIYNDGHIGANLFSGTQLRSLSADFTSTPEIYMDIVTELKSISFTEKGWLIYERDLSGQNSTKAFNLDPHTMVRITPLSDDLRSLCNTYIASIGYSENNLFTIDWTETSPQTLDLASLYAMLFGFEHNGETLTWYSAKKYYSQAPNSDLFLIPQAEFEETIQTYLNISTSEIRSIPEYNASAKAYYFLGWQTGYYSVVPRIPVPEVVDAWANPDGTITMVTDAVFSWYGTDRAFRHEVTVRPTPNGGFQYVGNKVLEDDNNIFYDCLLPSQRHAELLRIQHTAHTEPS